jgi:hypothetical protein
MLRQTMHLQALTARMSPDPCCSKVRTSLRALRRQRELTSLRWSGDRLSTDTERCREDYIPPELLKLLRLARRRVTTTGVEIEAVCKP